jgi:hypothetical protein
MGAGHLDYESGFHLFPRLGGLNEGQRGIYRDL